MSTPPRDMNQKIAANWPMPSRRMNMKYKIVGRRVQDGGRRLEHALHRRRVIDEPEDHRHDGDHDQPFDGARQPEPGVVAHLVRDLIAAAEDPAGQPVVAVRPLGEQVAQLAQHLQPEQQDQPAPGSGLHLELLAGRVGEAEDRVRRHLVPDDEEPDPGEQHDELDPVPDRLRPAGLSLGCEQAVLLAPLRLPRLPAGLCPLTSASGTSHGERVDDCLDLRQIGDEAVLIALHQEQVQLGRRAVGQDCLVKYIRQSAEGVLVQLIDATHAILAVMVLLRSRLKPVSVNPEAVADCRAAEVTGKIRSRI